MAELYDPNERFRSGLNTLAQSFIAGMQAKQEKEKADREFQFRQEEAQAKAKAQTAEQATLAYQAGLKGVEAGQKPEDIDRFVRAMAPQLYPDIVSQKPVSEILPPQELPIVRPPMRAPAADEQRNALQQIQVLGERLNSIDDLPAPENIKSNLREYLTGQLRQYQDVAFGAPSRVQELETRPRGESFVGARPIPIRPAGIVEQRAPAPSLFQAAPEKPLKPSEDPLVQAQKEIELNFRSGRMAPAEMEKYYRLKSEYNRTNDKNIFLQGLQTLKFRDRPVSDGAGGAQQKAADYRLLLGYQDVVRDTDQSLNEIQDNRVAQERAAADLKEQIKAVDANLIMTPIDKKQRKDALQKELGKVNNEIFKLDQQKTRRLEYSNKVKESINKLEEKVGLPGEFETEPEAGVPEDLSQASVEQLLKIMSGQ